MSERYNWLVRENRRHLRKVVRWLSAHFPTDQPVRVRFCSLADGNLELTKRHKGHYTVSVRHLLGVLSLAVDTLMHEWAHCRSWRPHLDGDPVFEIHHDDVWSIEYGKMYREYFDEGGAADVEEL